MDTNLFASASAVPADTVNNAGGAAYKLAPREALAKLACVGFLANTFYTSAQDQLTEILAVAAQCDDVFVGQVAAYARQKGQMKDTPAVLLAYLFGKKSPALTEGLFRTVIDNAKMASNFLRAVRSGKFGRVSLGTKGKRLLSGWLNRSSLDYLFRQSIAKDPSLADIIRLARPNPTRTPDWTARSALYRRLIGKEHVHGDLPQLVQDFDLWGLGAGPLPDVPFNMVDSQPLKPADWAQLFQRGGLQFIRMNLNTAQRQGVFKDPAMVKMVAERLSDATEVAASRQFPYQWLTAFLAVRGDVDIPQQIKEGLHAALEASTRNVPALAGNVYVAVDCSGSMASPVTGVKVHHSTHLSYMDVAALFAASIARTSPTVKVMTFNNAATFVPIEPRDTLFTIATTLAKSGGGTDCSAPLRLLATEKRPVDLFVLISDEESWLDHYWGRGGCSGTADAWLAVKRQNPNARQVRINISPNTTSQMPKRDDTLLVAGFSDSVFDVIDAWSKQRASFVDEVVSFSTLA